MGRYFFAWLFLVAFSGFVLGGSVTAEFFQPINQPGYSESENQSDQAAKEEGHERCEKIPFWDWTTCDPVAYFTFWLTAFTGILAISTVGLWVATQLILRDSRRTAKQQLRAYVFVEQADLEMQQPGNRPFIHINLKNSGNSPAWNLRSRTNVKLLPFPAKEDVPGMSDDEQAHGCLGPGGQFTLAFSLASMGDAGIVAITTGKLAIYAVGRVDYDDAFGRPQWLKFKVFYGGPEGPSPNGVMVSDITGNDASQ